MTIYLNGEFNTWNEKREYNLSLYGLEESFLGRMMDFMKKDVESLLKSEDFDKAQDLLEGLVRLREEFNIAKNKAKERQEEYWKEKSEEENING